MCKVIAHLQILELEGPLGETGQNPLFYILGEL